MRYARFVSDEPVRITGPLLDVLEAFAGAGGGELHGWAIIKATGRGGPTVYKILERLTDLGWATARWEAQAAEPNKPRRRYYTLTGVGVARAEELLDKRRPETRPALRPAFGGGSL
jgi:PadR family transcriptional regulator PadR